MPPYPIERGGFVCNLAIERRAEVRVVVERSVADVNADVNAQTRGGTHATANLGEPALIAAARALFPRWWGEPLPTGLRLHLTSDFPVGAGLGGSSAAGVAVAAALAAQRTAAGGEQADGEQDALTQDALTIDDAQRAALAEFSRAAEVEELGVAGGRQDHYAAAYGGALGLEFGEQVRVTRLPLDEAACKALESRLVVAYTGASRMSGDTITAVLDAYAAREAKVLHALDAMATLARQMANAIAQHAFDALGPMVREHWVHQRALHPAITTPLIDDLLATAIRAGATGGKALGASGGGCVMLLAPADQVPAVRRAIAGMVELLPIRVAREGVRVVAPD